jgi:hypothetical protein
MDLLSKHRATCQSRAEKQLVLVDPPPHRRGGEARATIAIEVDGGADSLVVTRKREVFGQSDVDRPQQELEDGAGVVAESLVAFAWIAARHPRDDQRLEAEREGRVGRFERRHAAVAERRFAADDAGARADDGGVPLVFRGFDRAFDTDRFVLSSEGWAGCYVPC